MVIDTALSRGYLPYAISVGFRAILAPTLPLSLEREIHFLWAYEQFYRDERRCAKEGTRSSPMPSLVTKTNYELFSVSEVGENSEMQAYGCGRQEVITKARGEQGSFLYKSTMGFGFPGPHPPAALFLEGKYRDTTAGSTYEQTEAEHLGSSL